MIPLYRGGLAPQILVPRGPKKKIKIAAETKLLSKKGHKIRTITGHCRCPNRKLPHIKLI
jgi:hypothetical protein